MNILNVRPSGWIFNTSASASMGVGPMVATKGMVVLEAPSGISYRFDFAAYGLGFGLRVPSSFRLPDIPLSKSLKGSSLTGSGATVDFPGKGRVFMTEGFAGDELAIQDFTGGVDIADASAGLLVAKGFTGFLAGIPTSLMLASIANPAFTGVASQHAKAVILTSGQSEGLIDGGGLTGTVGFLSYQGVYYG